MYLSRRAIRVMDSTLREGDQSPGNSMTPQEKLRLAHSLAKLNVDVIQAGIAVSGLQELEAVEAIAKAMSRTDVEVGSWFPASALNANKTWGAVKYARHPVLHFGVPVSARFLRGKNLTHSAVLQRAKDCLEVGRNLGANMKFGLEHSMLVDDLEFIGDLLEMAAPFSVGTVTVADTRGDRVPEQVSEFVTSLAEVLRRRAASDLRIGVHLHNDYGLAVANALAAVKAGATEVETTLLGIGERSGITPLEQFVMAARLPVFAGCFTTRVHCEHIVEAAQALAEVLRRPIPPQQPIVGATNFVHQAGLHVSTITRDSQAYNPFDPAEIGYEGGISLVFGKSSGTGLLKDWISEWEKSSACDDEGEWAFFVFLRGEAVKQKRSFTKDEAYTEWNKFKHESVGSGGQ